jgi:hypothetical protein
MGACRGQYSLLSSTAHVSDIYGQDRSKNVTSTNVTSCKVLKHVRRPRSCRRSFCGRLCLGLRAARVASERDNDSRNGEHEITTFVASIVVHPQ